MSGEAADPARGATAEGSRAEPPPIDRSRVISFTDSVFAFAITLLVLSFTVPSSSDGLNAALEGEIGNLFAYLLSIAVLGNFWIDHHRLFGRLARVDGPMIWLNLAYLAAIALIPFSCELIGEYGDQAVAVSIYSANMILVLLAYAGQIALASRNGLLRPGIAKPTDDTILIQLTVASVFAASIPIAILVSPTLATLSYLSLFFVGRLAARARA